MSAQTIGVALTLVACFMLLCRVDKMMKGVTRGAVFMQHAVLACGLFGSVVLTFTDSEEWALPCMALGVLLFFAFSVQRWKRGAPDGTTKPSPLGPAELDHISGGTSERKIP